MDFPFYAVQFLVSGNKLKLHLPRRAIFSCHFSFADVGGKPIDSLLDMPCDPEDAIRKRILDIVEYLAQIQEK
jgi:hypothetical protein